MNWELLCWKTKHMGESMSKHKDEEEQVRELWQHLFISGPRHGLHCHWLTEWVTSTHCWKTLPYSTPRYLWSLKHLNKLMRRHDLTNKKTMTKTKKKLKQVASIHESSNLFSTNFCNLWFSFQVEGPGYSVAVSNRLFTDNQWVWEA